MEFSRQPWPPVGSMLCETHGGHKFVQVPTLHMRHVQKKIGRGSMSKPSTNELTPKSSKTLILSKIVHFSSTFEFFNTTGGATKAANHAWSSTLLIRFRNFNNHESRPACTIKWCLLNPCCVQSIKTVLYTWVFNCGWCQQGFVKCCF